MCTLIRCVVSSRVKIVNVNERTRIKAYVNDVIVGGGKGPTNFT